jgi:hypothetical protein
MLYGTIIDKDFIGRLCSFNLSNYYNEMGD